jgi:uroporphyrin-III C-methyltransferase/precorrin-2 dehydrogenase/sirohydrochlorin ferrochelatase/uroporphyrin-III C-methyltransferase
MKQIYPKGKVYLVGAGSGDPELITVKGMRCLQQAEVVLTDRLASPEILTQFAAPGAEIIEVGKQCRKGNSTSQAAINELLVIYAREGKQIVRLKGGDVSVFSNILDELETLVQHHIDYEIVPGITAATGAAAYAGIPLTARNYATAVRFLTAYKPGVVSDAYWKELAATDDTLVFYMSSETLPDVVQQLVRNQIGPDKRLAVIEQATTPYQKVSVSSLYDFDETLKGRSFLSPTLVIIGKVVALHGQFDWFQTNAEPKEYFRHTYDQNPGVSQTMALTA